LQLLTAPAGRFRGGDGQDWLEPNEEDELYDPADPDAADFVAEHVHAPPDALEGVWQADIGLAGPMQPQAQHPAAAAHELLCCCT
jgi:hypothetical protein